MEPIETYEHAGVSVSIVPDPEPSDPREWDNLGHMVCGHRRYTLGDEQANSIEALKEAIEGARVALPLYLLDHSGISMSTGSFNDPWDSGMVGYIVATDEAIRGCYAMAPDAEIGEDVILRVTENLKGEVETYDAYLRNDVCGYIVAGDTRYEESCWGFFSVEDAKHDANEAAEHVAREIEKEAVEAAEMAARDIVTVAA